jgi:tetratricopeptide (TPR) repeat protein
MAAEVRSRMPVDTMMVLAEHALQEGNHAAACEFFESALHREPHNIDVLEAYGEVMFHHVHDNERARTLFVHSVEVSPDVGHVKFLNLAQLSDGAEAVACYDNACRVLRAELTRCKTADARDETNRALCEAKTALAELYLTDLCDEENAEQRCEAALNEALRYCRESVEVHQTLGSLRLSQERCEEALASLLQANELTYELDEAQQPSYESKVELGKLLMQVSLPDAFSSLLATLELDYENAYVWFLLGETARQRRRFPDAARLLKRARLVVDAENAEAVTEIDGAIQLLVTDMGGAAEVNKIPDMDHPNPTAVLQAEDESESDEDEDAEATED